MNYNDDEEHSVLEDDSEGEEQEEYMDDDDDGSSSLSIPNESIDFDLVYSLHSFAATIEGQANVVKGDSLFLRTAIGGLFACSRPRRWDIYPRKISRRRLNGWQDSINIVTLMYVNQFISYSQLCNPFFSSHPPHKPNYKKVR